MSTLPRPSIKYSFEKLHKGKKYLVDLNSISDQQLHYLRKAFDNLDRDNSGTIGIDELMEFQDSIGNPLTEEEIKEMFFENDLDGDLQLDFEEFASRLASKTEVHHDPVIEALKVFSNNMKHIDALQLRFILTSLGDNRFNEEEVKSLYREADIKISDKIDIEKFVGEWREKMQNEV